MVICFGISPQSDILCVVARHIVDNSSKKGKCDGSIFGESKKMRIFVRFCVTVAHKLKIKYNESL